MLTAEQIQAILPHRYPFFICRSYCGTRGR